MQLDLVYRLGCQAHEDHSVGHDVGWLAGVAYMQSDGARKVHTSAVEGRSWSSSGGGEHSYDVLQGFGISTLAVGTSPADPLQQIPQVRDVE